MAPRILRIERVLIAVADLAHARARWSRAGFAVTSEFSDPSGIRLARMGAGAIAIDLCEPSDADDDLSRALRTTIARGGGLAGWTWGTDDAPYAAALAALPGVFAWARQSDLDATQLRDRLRAECGPNRNTVEYLEHIVVMTPKLETAVAIHEGIGVPCRRIRDAGRGMRQAFFKLEQTVIEVVGPSPATPGGWGLAFMCGDIGAAVALARAQGLEATAPRDAIQGGKIARLVEPLDGVAVAFMQAAPPSPSL